MRGRARALSGGREAGGGFERASRGRDAGGIVLGGRVGLGGGWRAAGAVGGGFCLRSCFVPER